VEDITRDRVDWGISNGYSFEHYILEVQGSGYDIFSIKPTTYEVHIYVLQKTTSLSEKKTYTHSVIRNIYGNQQNRKSETKYLIKTAARDNALYCKWALTQRKIITAPLYMVFWGENTHICFIKVHCFVHTNMYIICFSSSITNIYITKRRLLNLKGN
jgi:hypothetical protein